MNVMKYHVLLLQLPIFWGGEKLSCGLRVVGWTQVINLRGTALVLCVQQLQIRFHAVALPMLYTMQGKPGS